jgi:3-deoxy-D-manno-octulosonic acid kinase
MKTIALDKQMIWYDDTLITDSVELSFDVSYWAAREAVIGSAQGRGTTWFVRLSHQNVMEAALRHYRRGGLFGRLVKDHYWFTSWEKTRSYQEFQLLKKLHEAGVNVPKPIAARTIKKTLCYQADLLSEKIPSSQDLVSILQKRPLLAQQYEMIGKEIRKMHDAQVNHTDLNIHNILIDAEGTIWLIDFDKCYEESDHRWKENNLDRLFRSFQKELNKRHIKWSEKEWEHLLFGYEHHK